MSKGASSKDGRTRPRERHIRSSAYYDELVQTRARDRGISFSEAVRQLIEEATTGRSAFRSSAIRTQANWIKERAAAVAKRHGGEIVTDMAHLIQCADKIADLA